MAQSQLGRRVGKLESLAPVSSAAGFIQVPGSGLWVAMALASGVAFIAILCELGGLEEFGCWSVESPLGCSLAGFAGGALSGSELLPEVPLRECEGALSLSPEAPVVEVVLLCWSCTVGSGTLSCGRFV